MLIKSIRLRNIRSYTDQKIAFPEGSLLLSGDIGAGKSTVLLAIEFALFGIIRGNLEGESLLRHGQPSGSVALEMEVDSKKISIYRSLKKTKDDVRQDSGYVETNGSRILGSPIELKARIIELLGYPKEALTRSKSLIFRYTVYTPQEEMRRILSDDSDARQETLRKVFGIDKYKRASENASIFNKSLREEKNLMLASSSGLENFESQLLNSQEKLVFSKKRAVELETDLILAQKDIFEKRREILKIEEDKKELSELKNRISLAESLLEDKKKRVLRIKEDRKKFEVQLVKLKEELKTINVPQGETDLQSAEEKMDQLIVEHNRLSVIRAKREQEAKSLEEQREEKVQELHAKEQKLNRLEGKKSLLSSRSEEIMSLEQSESTIDPLQKKTGELEKLWTEHSMIQKEAERLIEMLEEIDKCPLCLQEVHEEYKKPLLGREREKRESSIGRLEEIRHEKEHLGTRLTIAEGSRKKLHQINVEVAGIRKELEDLPSLKEEVEEKQRAIESISRKQKEAAKIISEMNEMHIFAIKKQMEETKELLKRMNEQKNARDRQEHVQKMISEISIYLETLEHKEIENEIRILNDEKETLAEKAKNFLMVEEQHSELSELIDEKLSYEKKLIIELATISSETDMIANRMKETQEEILSKRKFRQRAETISALSEWINKILIPSLTIMEEKVLSRVYFEFNGYFRNWFSMLIEDDTIFGRLSKDFSPLIEQNGYETSIENLSGGEKTSCALAYRLSLNKVINDLIPSIKTKDILILDEPTEGFSTEQLDRVRNVLSQLALRQVIIVSHEAKIESFVDNIIRIGKAQSVSSIEQ